jgi:hypothetical protein
MRTENDRIRRADSVEHSSQVLHPRLQRREMGAMIRKPCPALIEQDQPKRTRETLVKGAPVRLLPPVHEVRHVIGDIHKVRLAGTDNLVRDRGARAARVPDSFLHDSIFSEAD